MAMFFSGCCRINEILENGMHFRDRGNSIQVVRITYDEETKRPRQTVLGRIAKRTMTPEEELLKAATPAEQAEIRAWIERNSRIVAARAQVEAYSLPEVVRAAIRYFKSVTDETERATLQDMMLEASKRLRRVARQEEGAGEDEAAAARRQLRRRERLEAAGKAV